MGYTLITIIASLCFLLAPCAPSPIMVKFGTKEGPIVPAPPSSTTTTPPTRYQSQPAPVYENADDVPNPTVYKPLVPHQYRKKLYSYKPNPNLILGTPLDRKYTPGLQKNYGYQKFAKAFGIEYRGPQEFGHQEYNKYQSLNKYVQYNKDQYNKDQYNKDQYKRDNGYQEQPQDQDNSASRVVPQIGVIYSSGVRYYVPQVFYYQDDIDNSVYQANDLKYQHNYQQQYY